MWTDRQMDGQTDVGHINLIGWIHATRLKTFHFMGAIIQDIVSTEKVNQ